MLHNLLQVRCCEFNYSTRSYFYRGEIATLNNLERMSVTDAGKSDQPKPHNAWNFLNKMVLLTDTSPI